MLKVETFIGAILGILPNIGNCQKKFMCHIFGLYLSLRGRYNFLNMSRYGRYSEQSYRLNFESDFDFKAFNRALVARHCGPDLFFIFDPSYVSKSGKHTPHVGYFYSGCAGRLKWGLEIGGLAVGDVENHTAMHYHAAQTTTLTGEETLLL